MLLWVLKFSTNLILIGLKHAAFQSTLVQLLDISPHINLFSVLFWSKSFLLSSRSTYLLESLTHWHPLWKSLLKFGASCNFHTCFNLLNLFRMLKAWVYPGWVMKQGLPNSLWVSVLIQGIAKKRTANNCLKNEVQSWIL